MKRLFTLLILAISISLHAENPPIKLSLYPNPASSFVEISLNDVNHGDVVVSISDILGNKIKTVTFKSGEAMRLEFSDLDLKNGIYLIKVEVDSEIFLKRLVIKQ
ncbi:MAG: T9SS type A sorting domain-containing protein [Bacteroidetes bacterium]|nr:T9SS type A sorting domain-containing protein [Bacteroidota bacterium]